MEAASTVVIKVKYGDVLRRFNAQIVNEELDLSMDGLKEKILSLFSLIPGTELMLTYIDEDGDEVTLVDADDLRDAVKQGLDPLRITAKQISEKNGRQLNHSDLSSIPVKSPQVQQPLQSLLDRVSGILKNVPEPLCETLVNLFVDLISKVSESQTTAKPSINSDIPENNPAQTKTKDTDKSEVNAAVPKVQSNGREGASFKSNESLTKPQLDGLKAASSALDCGNSNVEEKLGESSCTYFDPPSVVPTEKEVNEPNVGQKTSNITASDPMKGNDLDGRMGRVIPGAFGFFPGSILMRTPGSSNLTGLLCGLSPTYESLYTVIPDGKTSAAVSLPCCDGCGIRPITGPRFKSKIKVGYDLCVSCFSVMGNDIDYIRIDSPVAQRKHMSSEGYYDPCHIPTLLQVCRKVSEKKSCASKLDSCFIQDVTVIDGTIMAPLTPFTKVWRMRNNGKVAWPQKTRIVWTGGDRLIDKFSVEVEIPVVGLPVDQDLDISIDLIAPAFPGRYISYWRMVSPSGQMFGHIVSVLIQVDASVKEIAPEIVMGLNLNLSLVSSSLIGPEVISANIKPIVEDSKPEPNSKKTVELVNASLQEYANLQESALKLPEKKAGSGASQESALEIPGKEVEAKKLLGELEETDFKLVQMNEHDLEQGVDNACCVINWDDIFEDLEEMGPYHTRMKKILLKKSKGRRKRMGYGSRWITKYQH